MAVGRQRGVVADESDPVRQHLVERTRLCLVEQRTVDVDPCDVLLRRLQRLLLHLAAHINLYTSQCLLQFVYFGPFSVIF